MEDPNKYPTYTPYMICGSSESLKHLSYAEEQLEYHKRKDERCENCKHKRRLMKLNTESSYCCSVYVNDKTDSDLFEIRLNEKCELYEREETEV